MMKNEKLRKMKIKSLFFLLVFLCQAHCRAAENWSVAGLFPLSDSGRLVYNFNQGWRFHLGELKAADGSTIEAAGLDVDDSAWEVVSVPHSPLLTPVEGSGGKNYQGVCWYRKHFTMPQEVQGKNVTLYFEAVMGKQCIYVNGQLVKEHLGGYLPIQIDLTACGVKAGEKALVAVKADNSDDKTYPPGKKQSQLDFCYHGGIYRDVWLIAKNSLAFTDAVARDKVAGGGLFVHYRNISDKSAEMLLDAEVGRTVVGQQASGSAEAVTVVAKVKDAAGQVVATMKQGLKVKDFATAHLSAKIRLPQLWSPENPYLYNVEVTLVKGGKVVDGGTLRTGIRSFEFRGQEGFWLNGKPYRQLVGGNRHQDFAYIGNALPNSQQWRDAKRLKEAGMNIIRVAHYPQDDAFMDACDELGIFMIVATPGWQYWNKDPRFGELVHENTRQIIRRDRNHPCVLMWEPILNETRYPEDFALQALQITKEEYPYPYRPVAAADMHSAGVKENYDVLYGWTTDIGKEDTPTDKCIFTREFGEMVDDWYAHNNLNRTARAWGERPQLLQALCLNETYNEMLTGKPSEHSALKAPSALSPLPSHLSSLTSPGQFIGGAQWHPFDHQRGYHPDTYYGGLYDAFRQKKYSMEMFRAMNPLSEPMVFIANEMTQFSDEDVVVFSNCDSVRLTLFEGDKVQTIAAASQSFTETSSPASTSASYPGIFCFKDFWNFWEARNYSYFQKNWQRVSLLAEGYKGGKIVCSQKKMPSRRSTKLRLYADDMGKPLEADGSDFIVVVAEVTDDNGNVRRLAMDQVEFEVIGEGSIIGDNDDIAANPRRVEWGSAPILLRSSSTPGKIAVIAKSWKDGATYALTPDTITIESVKPILPALYEELPAPAAIQAKGVKTKKTSPAVTPMSEKLSEADRQKMLEEVNRQQMEFGIGQ